jgi:hypothetical protein
MALNASGIQQTDDKKERVKKVKLLWLWKDFEIEVFGK